MSTYQRLKNHPDSPMKQFLDKNPEPTWVWIDEDSTKAEIEKKERLDKWRELANTVQDQQNEWEKTAKKQVFKEELLSERKNKKLLIDFIDDYFVPGWSYYKYMWNPFSTKDLTKVRDIICDYYQKIDFNTDDTYAGVFILGAFDNTTAGDIVFTISGATNLTVDHDPATNNPNLHLITNPGRFIAEFSINSRE